MQKEKKVKKMKKTQAYIELKVKGLKAGGDFQFGSCNCIRQQSIDKRSRDIPLWLINFPEKVVVILIGRRLRVVN